MSQTTFLKGVKNEIWVKTTAHVRQDDGRDIQVPFRLKCRKPERDEIRELSSSGKTDDEIAREYVLDWDMPGNDGEKVDFSAENFDIALRDPDYLKAVGNAMAELLFGKEALRAKNSSTSGGPGRVTR